MARRITGHSVGILAIRNGKGSEREVLEFSYTLKTERGVPWPSVRVPMETGERGESITDTVTRAFEEEIILKGSPFTFEFVKRGAEVLPVFFVLGQDEKSENREDRHLKAFFLITFEGILRDVIYEEAGPRGLEIHGKPMFTELIALFKKMERIGKIRAHQDAVLCAVEPLCQDKGVAMQYASVLAVSEKPIHSAEDMAMVRAYLAEHLK